MMEFLNDPLAAMATCVTLLFAASLLRREWERSMRRTIELELAGQGLVAHYAALNRFVGDPSAPETLVNVLDDFSATLGDRDGARRLALEILALSGRSDETRAPIRDELEALRRVRPDLADAFEAAIGSGLAALFLQDAETARLFVEAMTRLASDPWHGAAHVAQARAKIKADDRNGPFGAGQAVPA